MNKKRCMQKAVIDKVTYTYLEVTKNERIQSESIFNSVEISLFFFFEIHKYVNISKLSHYKMLRYSNMQQQHLCWSRADTDYDICATFDYQINSPKFLQPFWKHAASVQVLLQATRCTLREGPAPFSWLQLPTSATWSSFKIVKYSSYWW
jgi:hypothetical protein